MATKDQYEAAARKSPSQRSSHEQSLVERGSNMQNVRNLDHEAQQRERTYGRGR